MKTLGLIGAGNMGSAMLGGIVKAGLVKPENITVADLYQPSLDRVKAELGVNVTTDSAEVVKNCDAFIIALKPNIVEVALSPLAELVREDQLVMSIAAGKQIAQLEAIVGADKKVIRIMPNTPALVSECMAGICANKNVTKEELEEVKTIFESFGEAEIVTEKLMDAVTGVSGSGPAYLFLFIEAMADAAVLEGMPRPQAYKFAAQTVLGSAKMVLETGKHPGELKDMVCSPAGTTIEAVKVLEDLGLRSAVINAIHECTEKSKELSK